MERTAVQSRSLRSVAYDPKTEEITVEFRSGRVYCYSGVPSEVHAWLMRIADKGGFFNRTIRDRYPGRDVTEPINPPRDLEAALQESLTRES